MARSLEMEMELKVVDSVTWTERTPANLPPETTTSLAHEQVNPFTH